MRVETWTGRLYLALALATLLGYAACEKRGVVLSSAEEKLTMPPDVKSSRGGHRSHVFWTGGYQGGK